MDGLRQALDKLRTEVDKGVLRRREAETRSKLLVATLKEKEAELITLRERLTLTRQYLTVAAKYDDTRRVLYDYNEKVVFSNTKAEHSSEQFERLEQEKAIIEARCLDIQTHVKALETQLDDLL